MMNSFNFVAEEQENEDRGSDGRAGTVDSKENAATHAEKLSNGELHEQQNNFVGEVEPSADNSPKMQHMVQQVNIPSL